MYVPFNMDRVEPLSKVLLIARISRKVTMRLGRLSCSTKVSHVSFEAMLPMDLFYHHLKSSPERYG